MCLLNAISTEKCEAVIVFETQGPFAYQAHKPLQSKEKAPQGVCLARLVMGEKTI
jgi:hypothetical protein